MSKERKKRRANHYSEAAYKSIFGRIDTEPTEKLRLDIGKVQAYPTSSLQIATSPKIRPIQYHLKDQSPIEDCNKEWQRPPSGSSEEEAKPNKPGRGKQRSIIYEEASEESSEEEAKAKTRGRRKQQSIAYEESSEEETQPKKRGRRKQRSAPYEESSKEESSKEESSKEEAKPGKRTKMPEDCGSLFIVRKSSSFHKSH